ncbi:MULTISPECIES: GTPase-associated system all-helical protein GASH [Clostridia]|uniref:GTPase-associated system all-helical protein GASH n=1 Tax=Clostridia TaxID=186801 RepID=UPI00067EF196|nr:MULTISPECIES: GTPase-associated system all-helical protein GASH [Clostridia]
MDLEKMFYKWYKMISLDTPTKQIEDRWEGIKVAVDYYRNEELVSDLIKLYYKIPSNIETKTEFTEFFSNIDKGFDEDNDEEISILVGSVLAHLLQEDNAVFIAFALQVLAPYYESKLKELLDLADAKIAEMSKEFNGNNFEQKKIKKLDPEWETELTDDGQLSETAAVVLIDIIKLLQNNLEIVYSKNEALQEENERCQEKTQILSWIMGEWSDIIGGPLSEIFDIDAAIVLGVELADLVKVYPGPYAAEAFLTKMLGKCKKSEGGETLISLTDLIDSQEIALKEEIIKRYGDNCDIRNLPILAALKCSLGVDEKKAWVPFYKKAWKINPDEVKVELSKWTRLVYLECMTSNY